MPLGRRSATPARCTFPHGEGDRDALRAGRSLVVRLPLDVGATGSQEAGNASRGTLELIVIRTCSSEESDLLSVDNRREQSTT
ncbi:hypothetical protein [Geodermatophilus sp. URMC 60]